MRKYGGSVSVSCEEEESWEKVSERTRSRRLQRQQEVKHQSEKQEVGVQLRTELSGFSGDRRSRGLVVLQPWS